MKERDPRYQLVQQLFEVGAIKSFASIFKFIPKTVVARDMRIPVKRFTRLTDDPIEFGLDEIKKLGQLFGQEFRPFLEFVLKDI